MCRKQRAYYQLRNIVSRLEHEAHAVQSERDEWKERAMPKIKNTSISEVTKDGDALGR